VFPHRQVDWAVPVYFFALVQGSLGFEETRGSEWIRKPVSSLGEWKE